MNLPGFIETLPANAFIKILLTLLIVCFAVPVLFILIYYYRQTTGKILNRKSNKRSFNIHSFFLKPLFKTSVNTVDAALKIQLPVYLLFLVFLLFFPVKPDQFFVIITLFGTVILFLHFVLFLSQKDSVIRYFFLKRLRILFEYFFLLFFLVLLINSIDSLSKQKDIIPVLPELLRAFSVVIFFLSLWIIRHTLSSDMYLIHQTWYSKLSSTGKDYVEIQEQITGLLLLGLFLKISIRNNSFMMSLFNRSGINHPILIFLTAILFIIILDLFQRRLMMRYSWPDEHYLIRLNNIVFLPVLLITAISLVLI